MITATNIVKTYTTGNVTQKVLQNVSLDIEEGISVALKGKSGSGKSTLMHILSGLDVPDTGIVTVNGTSLLDLNSLDEFRNHTVGFIFQSFYLNPHATVLENVLLPAEIAGVVSQDYAVELLELVELQDFVDQKAVNLSGGQKQRAAIARALINKPKVIFADEPTGNLDATTSHVIEDLLFSLQKKQGTTLVVVTHDDELADTCDRQILLENGKITEL